LLGHQVGHHYYARGKTERITSSTCLNFSRKLFSSCNSVGTEVEPNSSTEMKYFIALVSHSNRVEPIDSQLHEGRLRHYLAAEIAD
jgi:hypothetical protein